MSDEPVHVQLNASQPKNMAVAARMRELLSEGRWAPGDQIPTARQLAQTFNVSLSPVLQALQVLEKEGLLVRRARVGTFVAERPDKKELLAFITSTCDLEPHLEVLQGFEAEAIRRGFNIIFCNANREPESFAHRATACRGQGASGIAFIPPEGSFYVDWNRAFYKSYAERGVPVVAICSQPFPDDDPAIISAAIPDCTWQGRTIGAHLIERGHRQIAYLYGRWSCTVEERMHGLLTELKQAGLPDPDIRSLSPEEMLKTGEVYNVSTMLSDWLGRTPPVTAVVCCSDYAARILYDHARSMGLSIPDDVSVTGFDDCSFSSLLSPPLTTIRVSYKEMGRSAAELLVSQVNDKQRPPRLLMSRGELMVRDSTAQIAEPVAQ